MPDALTREQRSALMSRVKTRDTAPEVALRRALWAVGVRGWRCHPKSVPGKPDLAWIGRRVAVFVDGAFWHGHPDHYWGQSGAFWDAKIARNRARDELVNAELAERGWRVVRLWDFEVERDLPGCVAQLQKVVSVQPLRPQASAGSGSPRVWAMISSLR
jgi:DNA mismatch endonuclease (patch repair protein)